MSFLERWRREKAAKKTKKMGKEGPGTIMRVAWFTEAEWNKLTEIVPDRSTLDDTFQAWEKSADTAIKMLQDRGITAVPVLIAVAELQAWCEEQGREADGAARAAYVSHLLQNQSREHP